MRNNKRKRRKQRIKREKRQTGSQFKEKSELKMPEERKREGRKKSGSSPVFRSYNQGQR